MSDLNELSALIRRMNRQRLLNSVVMLASALYILAVAVVFYLGT